MKPCLIGVAGPSGAGKSELSRLIARRLPGPTALLSLDSYYRALSHLSFEERAQCNFDHPDSLDWELIHRDVAQVRLGHPIDEPIYLFDRHSRAAETRHIEPAPFLILEGLFALYDEAVRNLHDARIYVNAPGAREVALSVYRMGWYHGRGGRLVLQSRLLPVVRQPGWPPDRRLPKRTRPEAHHKVMAEEIATLGGGCFWCLEAVFDELDGVISVESGYAGGRRPNPTYQQVCSGATGHAEVVRVKFDPEELVATIERLA